MSSQFNEFQIRFEAKTEAYDTKLDAYQRTSQQVVNIAFGLLATATLAIIISAVLNK